MAVYYNLTQFSTNVSQGLLPMTRALNNDLMMGWGGTLFLIGIACILFFGFFRATGETIKAFTGTSFICFALSLLMTVMGLVTDKVMFTCLAAFAISLAFSVREGF